MWKWNDGAEVDRELRLFQFITERQIQKYDVMSANKALYMIYKYNEMYWKKLYN